MKFESVTYNIQIQLSVDEASFLHAMMNPNYFLNSDMSDMDIEAYTFGVDLKKKLAEFVKTHYKKGDK